MVSSLWSKKNFLAPYSYIVAHHIYEYDIQKANINVLYELNLIDSDYYDRLCKMDRMSRQVEIGYLLKYNEGLSDKLSAGIELYRKKLFYSNNIEDMDVLSIKNDAVFIVDKILKNTVFGRVKFVLKNTYTTYVKLGDRLEVYFEYDSVTGNISLTIKGISDKKLELHRDYMASVIANTLYYIETGDLESGLTYITEIWNSYISYNLDIGFYRNFNSDSNYTIRVNNALYSIPFCDKKDIQSLDISCNFNIIRDLYGNLIHIYFQKHK